MPQLIQRAPYGLLSILDSKAGGIAPNALNDLVQGTIDLGPLYEIQNRRSVNSLILAAALVQGYNDGAPTLVQPPAGTIWHLIGLSARTGATTIANLRLAVGVRDTRNSGFYQIGPMETFPTVGNQGVVGGTCDFWMTPNEICTAWCVQGAGAADVTLTAYFHEFIV